MQPAGPTAPKSYLIWFCSTLQILTSARGTTGHLCAQGQTSYDLGGVCWGRMTFVTQGSVFCLKIRIKRDLLYLITIFDYCIVSNSLPTLWCLISSSLWHSFSVTFAAPFPPISKIDESRNRRLRGKLSLACYDLGGVRLKTKDLFLSLQIFGKKDHFLRLENIVKKGAFYLHISFSILKENPQSTAHMSCCHSALIDISTIL